MGFIELLITGLGSIGLVKSMMLLVVPTDDIKVNDLNYDELLNYRHKIPEKVKDMNRAKQFVAWVADDRFKSAEKPTADSLGIHLTLGSLKEEILDFYFKTLQNLSEEKNDINLACDVEGRIADYVIQLMRLRMVVEPQIQISKFVHPQTNISYLYVKSFWIDDRGKKKRKFSKLLGKAEDYSGIKDVKALKDGLETIRPVMMEHYKELYPD